VTAYFILGVRDESVAAYREGIRSGRLATGAELEHEIVLASSKFVELQTAHDEAAKRESVDGVIEDQAYATGVADTTRWLLDNLKQERAPFEDEAE
jgi:hypothetical protein